MTTNDKHPSNLRVPPTVEYAVVPASGVAYGYTSGKAALMQPLGRVVAWKVPVSSHGHRPLGITMAGAAYWVWDNELDTVYGREGEMFSLFEFAKQDFVPNPLRYFFLTKHLKPRPSDQGEPI